MSEVRFSVPGEPVAWARPGLSFRGMKPHGFTHAKPAARRELIKAVVLAIVGKKPVGKAIGVDMFLGPVVVGLAHFRKPPKRVKLGKERGWDQTPTQRPDLDNYDKLVLDALEGIVYSNDSQVVGTMGWPAHGKHYAGGEDDPEGEKGQPRTEVVVMPLEEFRQREKR